MSEHPTLREAESDWRPRLFWPGVCLTEAALLLGYFGVAPAEPTGTVRYLLYPFIWINLGLWAVSQTSPSPRSGSHRRAAVLLAAGYFLVVLWIPGQIGIGAVGPDQLDLGATHARVVWAAPGWGPALVADGAVRLYLVPFEVVGYSALAYLVYAAVLDATRGVLSGALGFATCVGCTVPVAAPLVGILGGPATGLASTAYTWSYDFGTLLFALTVGLLVWSHWRAEP